MNDEPIEELPENVIVVNLYPDFRRGVVQELKTKGKIRTEQALIESEIHPAFSKALIKSIMSKEGW